MTDTIPDYRFIRLWGRFEEHTDKMIEKIVQQARDENAPDTAIFKSATGDWWWAFEDIERGSTIAIMRKWEKELGWDNP